MHQGYVSSGLPEQELARMRSQHQSLLADYQALKNRNVIALRRQQMYNQQNAKLHKIIIQKQSQLQALKQQLSSTGRYPDSNLRQSAVWDNQEVRKLSAKVQELNRIVNAKNRDIEVLQAELQQNRSGFNTYVQHTPIMTTQHTPIVAAQHLPMTNSQYVPVMAPQQVPVVSTQLVPVASNLYSPKVLYNQPVRNSILVPVQRSSSLPRYSVSNQKIPVKKRIVQPESRPPITSYYRGKQQQENDLQRTRQHRLKFIQSKIDQLQTENRHLRSELISNV